MKKEARKMLSAGARELILMHTVTTIGTFACVYLLTRDLGWSSLSLVTTAIWMWVDNLKKPK